MIPYIRLVVFRLWTIPVWSFRQVSDKPTLLIFCLVTRGDFLSLAGRYRTTRLYRGLPRFTPSYYSSTQS